MKDILCCGETNIGKRKINQDACAWLRAETEQGIAAFAVVCDGMGGLQKGEEASAEVVRAFARWFEETFPALMEEENFQELLFKEWKELTERLNEQFIFEGRRSGAPMGTTMAALLLFDGNWYAAHVGDSRIYEIREEAVCLTRDHSRVMQYLTEGKIRPEEMETHPERNILLKCIGDEDEAEPDFGSGACEKDTVFLLCSDGFRHKVTAEELAEVLDPARQADGAALKRNVGQIMALICARGERDNATAVALKVIV